MKHSPRETISLSDSLHRHLNSYALAASAAGVGVLALSQPVEAKIVYTPAHVTLRVGQAYGLDLNHLDGKVDFYVVQHRFVGTGVLFFSDLSVCHAPLKTFGGHCYGSSTAPNALNGVRAWPKGAAAMRAGAKIEPGERFLDKKPVPMGSVLDRYGHVSTPYITWSGAWVNGGKGVKNRYLDLKFKIKGRFHFGWARLTVTTAKASFTSTLTGYAYETIPWKAIIAGATKGPDDAEPVTSLNTQTPKPATLGMLALGAPGLSIWRREESVSAAPEGI